MRHEERKSRIRLEAVMMDDKIIELRYEGRSMPLKKPIPLEAYQDFKEKLNAIAEYVDISQWTELIDWSTGELRAFLKSLSPNALNFYRKLANAGSEGISINELCKQLHITPEKLRGILSSPGQRVKSFGLEVPHEVLWDDQRNVRIYRIRPKYIKMMQEVLETL